ncbi:unnamed protein product, partial [marine sediment metagenome]
EKAILEITGCNLRLRGEIEEGEEKPRPIRRDRLDRKDNHNSTKEVFEVFGGGKIINND